MKLHIKLDGLGAVEVEGEGVKEVLIGAAFWHSLPSVCPLCKAPLRFFFRTPQEFTYYGLFCLGNLTHESNFGQKKVGGALFYKGRGSWREATGYHEESDEEQASSDSPANPSSSHAATRNGVAATSEPEHDWMLTFSAQAQTHGLKMTRELVDALLGRVTRDDEDWNAVYHACCNAPESAWAKLAPKVTPKEAQKTREAMSR